MDKADSEGRTRRRVTTIDVARDAELSRATVSLVLRESPLVAPATRDRVWASVRKLGYVYHRQAASLRSARTNTVGMVITDLANPFFAELTVGIEDELAGGSYVALLAQNSEDPAKQDRVIRTMLEHGVDGLILCPVPTTSAADLERLRDRGLPAVLVARRAEGYEGDYVGVENALGTRRATEHLLGLGHRQVAFVGGPGSSTARLERIAGVRSALADSGLDLPEERTLESPISMQAGFDAAVMLMRSAGPPTAIICYNDIVAFGVMLGLRAAGVEPGTGCAVIGFDDIENAALQRPSLTTLATDAVAMGRSVARLLVERIKDPARPAESIIEVPRLVVRDSSGPARADAEPRLT